MASSRQQSGSINFPHLLFLHHTSAAAVPIRSPSLFLASLTTLCGRTLIMDGDNVVKLSTHWLSALASGVHFHPSRVCEFVGSHRKCQLCTSSRVGSYENRMKIKSLSRKLCCCCFVWNKISITPLSDVAILCPNKESWWKCLRFSSRAPHTTNIWRRHRRLIEKKVQIFIFRRANRAKQKLRCWTQESELRENERKKNGERKAFYCE